MWVSLCVGLLFTAPEEREVISFKGLLELESKQEVPDARKVQEWTAFVERTEERLAYARRAIERWENAARERQLERALALEQNSEAPPTAKESAWRAVAETRASEAEADKALRRAEHWHRVESERLVKLARQVEEEGALKGARIAAWARVVAWARPGGLREAAQARIRALQGRLLEEARALDEVERVDAQTKIAAWRAVLDGAPTAEEAAEAKARIEALQR